MSNITSPIISGPGGSFGANVPAPPDKTFLQAYIWNHLTQLKEWSNFRKHARTVNTTIELHALDDGQVEPGTAIYNLEDEVLYVRGPDPATGTATDWLPLTTQAIYSIFDPQRLPTSIIGPLVNDVQTALEQLDTAVSLISGGVVLAGLYDATNNVILFATQQGANATPAFIVGNDLPVPVATLTGFYVIVTVAGDFEGNPVALNDRIFCDGASWFIVPGQPVVPVLSVHGRLGNVTAEPDDIPDINYIGNVSTLGITHNQVLAYSSLTNNFRPISMGGGGGDWNSYTVGADNVQGADNAFIRFNAGSIDQVDRMASYDFIINMVAQIGAETALSTYILKLYVDTTTSELLLDHYNNHGQKIIGYFAAGSNTSDTTRYWITFNATTQLDRLDIQVEALNKGGTIDIDDVIISRATGAASEKTLYIDKDTSYALRENQNTFSQINTFEDGVYLPTGDRSFPQWGDLLIAPKVIPEAGEGVNPVITFTTSVNETPGLDEVVAWFEKGTVGLELKEPARGQYESSPYMALNYLGYTQLIKSGKVIPGGTSILPPGFTASVNGTGDYNLEHNLDIHPNHYFVTAICEFNGQNDFRIVKTGSYNRNELWLHVKNNDNNWVDSTVIFTMHILPSAYITSFEDEPYINIDPPETPAPLVESADDTDVELETEAEQAQVANYTLKDRFVDNAINLMLIIGALMVIDNFDSIIGLFGF